MYRPGKMFREGRFFKKPGEARGTAGNEKVPACTQRGCSEEVGCGERSSDSGRPMSIARTKIFLLSWTLSLRAERCIIDI